MSQDTVSFGKWGETEAVSYLKEKGYQILCTNWHCRWGEIDIVAKRGETICFFEVKTRASSSYLLESLSKTKMNHLLRSILFYLKERNSLECSYQVDFIGIEKKGSTSSISHIENVMEARI